MQVRITDHFMACMATLETFLDEAGAQQAYDALLVQLQEVIVPNLEQHPQMGRALLQRPLHSIETTRKVEALRARHGNVDIREYITGDYLILYTHTDNVTDLLSIRHHKQLSYELGMFWRE